MVRMIPKHCLSHHLIHTGAIVQHIYKKQHLLMVSGITKFMSAEANTNEKKSVSKKWGHDVILKYKSTVALVRKHKKQVLAAFDPACFLLSDICCICCFRG